VTIGAGGNVHKNAPFAIAETQMIMSVFALFIMTAFVANVVIRDDETGFAPMIRATRVSKFDYLFGRIRRSSVGLAFLSVPLGMIVGALMPWLDPETLGPFRLGDYAYVYLVLCVPTLFVMAAGFFALATATRSMLSTYVGLIAFLVLYLLASAYFARPEFAKPAAYVDPFGLAALDLTTRYWTASERNTRLPPLTDHFLWNRLLWVGVAFALLGLAWTVFNKERKPRKSRKNNPEKTREAAAVPNVTKTGAVRMRPRRPPARTLPPLHAAPRPQVGRAALAALTRFDMVAVFRSPAFVVLLGIGFINAIAGLWFADERYGNTIHPVTRVMIDTLVGNSSRSR
jgi:hypothetical protein